MIVSGAVDIGSSVFVCVFVCVCAHISVLMGDDKSSFPNGGYMEDLSVCRG